MVELNDAIRSVNQLRSAGEQLTGYDAATWRTSLGDRTMRSTVVGLILLDEVPDWERLQVRFERLTRVIPVLRKRPIHGVVGVSAPRLAVDPDFDLGIHLHRIALPAGAGWQDVLAEARRMSLTDFDLGRPLWEAVLIEGLAGGRSAMVIKLHHAIADGQAAVMIGANLFELTPKGTPGEPEAPAPPEADDAGHRDVSRANILDNVRRGVGAAGAAAKVLSDLATGTLKDPVSTWTDAIDMVGSVSRFAEVPDAALSPLMQERSTTYRFSVFDLPFDDIRAAAKTRKASANDVFMASVATGLAKYHERHGMPTGELRFNLPISLRSAVKDGSGANAVTIARFPLPINGVTIADRLEAAHEQVRRWREEPALTLANPLADVSWLVPVPVMASVARASDVTTSNVPGPPIPLYLAGVRAVGIWPLVATIGAATNITMVTYDGTAFVGISTDTRAIPDPDDMVADLRGGFSEVLGTKVGPADPLAKTGRGDVESHAEAVRDTLTSAARAGTQSAAKRVAAKKAAAKTAAKEAAKEAAAKRTAAKRTAAKKAATKSTSTKASGSKAAD